MKTTKHTPGPWWFDDAGKRVRAPASASEFAPCPAVATVHYVARSRGQVLADGHLIAAAPDLLEAARAARDAIDSLMGDSDLDDDDSDEMLAMRALDAAIARAEGGGR